MIVRGTLVAALVVSGAIAVATPPSTAAATLCQGHPATVEGSTGTLTGTDGNDVIAATGPDVSVVAGAGDDLVCVIGGSVTTGPGNDSVVSTAAAGTLTYAHLFGGADSYLGGAGRSSVTVDEVSSVQVTLGSGGGTTELFPTSTTGTGSIDFGAGPGYLYAFGDEESRVDLAAQTVSVDGRLSITTTGLHGATATGCRVRMRGDDGANVLDAYGHDIAVSGGGGRDRLARIGNGFGLDLPTCGGYKSLFRGQGGPDRLTGRRGDDVLIGGPGRDVALGAGGSDTCRAEVRRNCER